MVVFESSLLGSIVVAMRLRCCCYALGCGVRRAAARGVVTVVRSEGRSEIRDLIAPADKKLAATVSLREDVVDDMYTKSDASWRRCRRRRGSRMRRDERVGRVFGA